MPADRGAASPHVRVWLTLSTSLGAWEARLCALSLSGDKEPTDHGPRLGTKQQPPGMLDCPRVMLLLAPEMHTQSSWWNLDPSATEMCGPPRLVPIPHPSEGAHLLSTEKSLSLAILDIWLCYRWPWGEEKKEAMAGQCILTFSLPPMSTGLVSGATERNG